MYFCKSFLHNQKASNIFLQDGYVIRLKEDIKQLEDTPIVHKCWLVKKQLHQILPTSTSGRHCIH